MHEQLKNRILNKKAQIGIIGLGYVGLPLAVEFARAGFRVTGIDTNKKRIDNINSGSSYILDVADGDLAPLVERQQLTARSDFRDLKELDVIIICVPTPLTKTKEPDISYIMAAAKEVSSYIREGQLVILESTTYPGTSEEVILPMLGMNGLKVGQNFHLAFSPERVDPGNKQFTTGNISKVVGGVTQDCTKIARLLYQQIVKEVVPVSSTKVAEMVKLFENTFRSVNIGLVNELTLMCDKLKINVWEVIEAAKSKPFGFMPFYPGPGIGGECIPADPMYLAWKARLHGFEARFIELASQINSYMPYYVINRLAALLNTYGKSIKGSNILNIGAAYKKDVSDTRESPALAIINILKNKKAKVFYHDPYVPSLRLGECNLKSVGLTEEALKDKDCTLILTDHSCLDYALIAKHSKLVLDTRNALRNVPGDKNKIIRL